MFGSHENGRFSRRDPGVHPQREKWGVRTHRECCANRLLHSAAQVETGHPFVHGLLSPAANALRFKAMFKADDSSETVATSHEMVKQPSGEWLFTRWSSSSTGVV